MADKPDIRTIILDKPIVRGAQTIDRLQLRKPDAGAFRGINLVDLGQLKTDALIKVIPRICLQSLTEPEVAAMDTADLFACGAEIGSFLLQKRQLTAVHEQ